MALRELYSNRHERRPRPGAYGRSGERAAGGGGGRKQAWIRFTRCPGGETAARLMPDGIQSLPNPLFRPSDGSRAPRRLWGIPQKLREAPLGYTPQTSRSPNLMSCARSCGKSSLTLHQMVGTVIKTPRGLNAWNVWQRYFAETTLKEQKCKSRL
jgi:hypothetical protein